MAENRCGVPCRMGVDGKCFRAEFLRGLIVEGWELGEVEIISRGMTEKLSLCERPDELQIALSEVDSILEER